jgi:hypothetical protein
VGEWKGECVPGTRVALICGTVSMRLARTGVLPLMILICGCIFLLFPRQWLITTTGDPGECHLTHVYLPVWCHLSVFRYPVLLV